MPATSEFYVERLDNPKLAAKREHSRRVCMARWSKPGAHDHVDTKQAKPLDVFDMQGNYIATYPSSKKAAIALGLKNDNDIRKCRRGGLKSYNGFRFRDHEEGVTKIEPYSRKPHKRGYHYIRKPDIYKYKPLVEIDEKLGVLREWPSVKEAAADIGCSMCGIWIAMKQGRPIKGHTLQFK